MNGAPPGGDPALPGIGGPPGMPGGGNGIPGGGGKGIPCGGEPAPFGGGKGNGGAPPGPMFTPGGGGKGIPFGIGIGGIPGPPGPKGGGGIPRTKLLARTSSSLLLGKDHTGLPTRWATKSSRRTYCRNVQLLRLPCICVRRGDRVDDGLSLLVTDLCARVSSSLDIFGLHIRW